MANQTLVLAGVPASNYSLYHRTQFLVADAAVWMGNVPSENGKLRSMLLVRDIEMNRARERATVDQVGCSADFAPATGLSGDRDTALAQATVEFLRRAGVDRVGSDRTLPYLFAWHLQQAGIEVDYEPDLGVCERRAKTAQELDSLREAQSVTQEAMTMACQWIAQATTDSSGLLHQENDVLTSERVRRKITQFCVDRGYSTPLDSIVATVPHVADCHHFGTGPLKTGLPVIVDIFPRNESSRYWGDCTRTVVHGTPSEEVERMHAAVQEAKRIGVESLRPGVRGEAVHEGVVHAIERGGYGFKRGCCQDDESLPVMRHGTGHGIGLDVHEPILLDQGGEEMLANEVFTVEPGLYSSTLGGVRIEDMAVVTPSGGEILSELHEGLDWV